MKIQNIILCLIILFSIPLSSADSSNPLTVYYSTPDSSGSVIIQDTNQTGGICTDGSYMVLTGDKTGDTFPITIEGDIVAGCEITLQSNNYDYYETITIDFINTLFPNLPYEVTINNVHYETKTSTDGNYTITIDDLESTTLIRLEGAYSSSSGSRSSTDDSRDSTPSTMLTSSSSSASGTVERIIEFIIQPINWLIVLGSYIGVYFIQYFGKEEKGKKKNEKVDLNLIVIVGTLGWFIPITLFLIGINPFIFNYILSTTSPIIGFTNFLLYGAVTMLVSNEIIEEN